MHARADVGILTTARDLAKWAIALESGRILSRPERLFVPFTGSDGRDLGYAYGWVTGVEGGHRMAMHNGGFRTGFRSSIVYFPDDALTIALVTNCSGCGGSLSRPIAAYYLKDFIDVPQAARVDDKPDDSAKLIAALRSLASGKMDAAVFAVDAVPDLSDVADALKNAELSVVARHDLRSRKLRAHGRELADLVLVKVATKQVFHLGLYRDGDGKVQFVEPID
jgi:CubicO group peptidase (beta-lactamase class C family)